MSHRLRRKHGCARLPSWAQHTSRIGKRVQLSPHLDRWMMGDRYGDVVAAGRAVNTWKVKLDKSGKTILYRGADLQFLPEYD